MESSLSIFKGGYWRIDMNKQKEKIEKKPWVTPQLTVYGDVEKLTTEVPGPKPFPSASGVR